MQKLRNTFSAATVQILLFLCFYIGLFDFVVSVVNRLQLLLIDFLFFLLLFRLLVGVIVFLGWGGIIVINTTNMREIPLLCITFLHQYFIVVNVGVSTGSFWNKYRCFISESGKKLGSPCPTLIKPLSSPYKPQYELLSRSEQERVQSTKSQKSPDYGIQQERRQEPNLRKHLKAAAIQL